MKGNNDYGQEFEKYFILHVYSKQVNTYTECIRLVKQKYDGFLYL